ncbi:hypothetical protein BRADI_3g57335v3 [Brachypodium distachyon]|uniref:Knottin scorpion toxin-like domain-containing protein n=1 Tax=Brachypodium distachyon TaxID=15368 RepID=A0A2K2D5J2_BRADI|nr:hypothetical protein BRADI_3g57335v3 [Brachypodium distachyon]
MASVEEGLYSSTDDYSQYTCTRFFPSGNCYHKPCNEFCGHRLSGYGKCLATGCQCSYYCQPPPSK